MLEDKPKTKPEGQADTCPICNQPIDQRESIVLVNRKIVYHSDCYYKMIREQQE